MLKVKAVTDFELNNVSTHVQVSNETSACDINTHTTQYIQTGIFTSSNLLTKLVIELPHRCDRTSPRSVLDMEGKFDH